MSSQKRRRFSLLLFALVLLAVVPTGVFAEDARLEFVLTADRVQTDVLSTAAGVSIITADDIAESAATNLVDLLASLAGVDFRGYSSGEQQVSMRGFGENAHGRVLVLLDGWRQNSPDMAGISWYGIPLDSVQRIEVIRGSASAEYGNNAVAGVINIITRNTDQTNQSDGKIDVQLEGSFGSFWANSERVWVRATGESAGFSALLSHESSDGWRDRTANQRWSFSAGGNWQLADDLLADISARVLDIHYELPGGLSEAQFLADPTQATNQADENAERHYGADVSVLWQAGDRLEAGIAGGYAYRLTQSDMASWPQYADRLLQRGTVMPELTWMLFPADRLLRLHANLDVELARLDGSTFTSAARTSRTSAFVLGQDSAGLGISGDLALAEQWDAGISVRYDCSSIYARNSGAGLDESAFHQAFVYQADVVFRPLENMKLYLSGGSLFRYPFVDEQADASATSFLSDLRPERGYTLDFGTAVYLGDLFQLDASLYWLQMYDEIVYVGMFPAGQNENYEATRRLGGDVSLRYQPHDVLELTASYSYVLPKYTAGDYVGKQITLISNHTAVGELIFHPGLGLSIGAGIDYRSGYYMSNDQDNSEDMTDAVLLTDIFASWDFSGSWGDVRVSGGVSNLLDVMYSRMTGWSWYPEDGRTMNITVSWMY